MLSLDTFLVFAGAALVLAALPGPGLLYIAGRTLAGGRRVGLASCVGSALGGLVHVLAGALGVSALIVGLQPLLTAAFAGAVLGERVAPRQWAGLGLGLLGVALVLGRKLGQGPGDALGALACVAALLGYRGMEGDRNPLRPEVIGHAMGKAVEATSERADVRKVLLAEDNPVNQEVAVALIGSTGVVVDVASDGQQAVDMVRNGDYANVLMDVKMPVLDGLDATRAIRRLPQGAQLPILAMTANAFDEERKRCMDAGMDDHLSKPVDPAQLFTMLLRWLPDADRALQR